MDSRTGQSKPPMGMMQNKIAAPYDFSMCDVLSESWAKVKGFKAPFWGALSFNALVVIAVTVVSLSLQWAAVHWLGADDKTMTSLANVITTLILLPMMVGFFMLGIRCSVDQPVKASQIFDYYPRFLGILGVYVAQWLILTIVVFLCILLFTVGKESSSTATTVLCDIGAGIVGLVFIYLTCAYMFALVIKVEKNYGIWACLEASRKAVSQHFFKFIFTFLAMEVLIVVSMVPVFIGLIWTLPMVTILTGVLYRTMFGVEEVR